MSLDLDPGLPWGRVALGDRAPASEHCCGSGSSRPGSSRPLDSEALAVGLELTASFPARHQEKCGVETAGEQGFVTLSLACDFFLLLPGGLCRPPPRQLRRCGLGQRQGRGRFREVRPGCQLGFVENTSPSLRALGEAVAPEPGPACRDGTE